MTLQLQAQKLETSLDICDRKYKFKTYKKCFIGSDAVKEIISLNLAINENEAMEFGNKLIDSDIIQHVTKGHTFKNEKLFYRFTDKYYNRNSCKSTLDELNSLPAPKVLFNDINSFISNIQTLSKEYSMEWNKYSQYNLDLRTMIRSGKQQNTSVSMGDIQSFVKRMNLLKASVNQLVDDFFVKRQNGDSSSNGDSEHNSSMEITSLGTKASGKRYRTRQSLHNNDGPVNAFTYHSDLLRQSRNDFNGFGFYGCSLDDCDMKSDVEMRDVEIVVDESKKDVVLDQQGVANYYHDNYYGQGGITYFTNNIFKQRHITTKLLNQSKIHSYF